MDFDNLPHHVLMKIMMYVSIQDRLENVRLVSKRWKSVAEDSLRRERKLTVNLKSESDPWMNMKIKPTDHHSIVEFSFQVFNTGLGVDEAWLTGMVRYWSHVFSHCPNLEELYMYDAVLIYYNIFNKGM